MYVYIYIWIYTHITHIYIYIVSVRVCVCVCVCRSCLVPRSLEPARDGPRSGFRPAEKNLRAKCGPLSSRRTLRMTARTRGVDRLSRAPGSSVRRNSCTHRGARFTRSSRTRGLRRCVGSWGTPKGTDTPGRSGNARLLTYSVPQRPYQYPRAADQAGSDIATAGSWGDQSGSDFSSDSKP